MLRVIHGSHFQVNFNFIFNLIFQKWSSEWDENDPKIIIFEKSNPSLAFTKMVIFHFYFPITFSVLSNSALTPNLFQRPPLTTTHPTLPPPQLVMGKGFRNPGGMGVWVLRVWVRVWIWRPSRNPYPSWGSGVTLGIYCRFFIFRSLLLQDHNYFW